MNNNIRKLNLIFASTKNLGIGKNNNLPWPKLKRDMDFFQQITTNVLDKNKINSVIMGFNTFASLNYKILNKRKNIVITRKNKIELDKYNKNNLIFVNSYEDAIKISNDIENIEQNFVIGGAQIYNTAIENRHKINIDRLYWTRIFKDIDTDVKLNNELFKDFISDFNNSFVSKTMVDHSDINYDFRILTKENDKFILKDKIFPSEEYQYLDLLKEISEKGEERPDRTNTGIKSLFGKMMRFDLSESFPLLTTKKVFYRGIFEELLWFLRGETNGEILLNKNVTIWKGNGTREFLDKRGLVNNKENDLGPVYGFQWRHFGAEYETCESNYEGKGIDQLSLLIQELKANKFSRRHILSSWNPTSIPQMALPPCHVLFQLYVSSDNKLSCSLYQRSGDVGLGIPFNIASYAMLTCLLAHHLNFKRGEFIHFMGDTHIYLNHLEVLKTQINKIPNPFPILEINPLKKRENIWDYQIEDFELKNYEGQGILKMKMAV